MSPQHLRDPDSGKLARATVRNGWKERAVRNGVRSSLKRAATGAGAMESNLSRFLCSMGLIRELSLSKSLTRSFEDDSAHYFGRKVGGGFFFCRVSRYAEIGDAREKMSFRAR